VNTKIEDGGPAFPNVPSDPGYTIWDTGMTLRQYAAIHLKQPTSGTPWLDEMILAAKRDELVVMVWKEIPNEVPLDVAMARSRIVADAMLAARKERK
jgi:hypothetical protein